MKNASKLAAMLMIASLSACSSSSSSDEPVIPKDEEKGVEFLATLASPASRISDTKFENGDPISVWAMKSQNGNPQDLNVYNCYAANRRYVYDGTRFTAANAAIEKNTGDQLNYYAVYPYSSSYSESFTFKVNEDQTTKNGYDTSDLCVAKTGVLTSATVDLTFRHAMSQVVIDVAPELGTVTAITLVNVCMKATIDLNAWTINSTDSSVDGTVKMNPNGMRSFRAVIAPCKLPKGTQFAIITTTNGTYNYNLEVDTKFENGTSTNYQLQPAADNESAVSISGSIAPWITK